MVPFSGGGSGGGNIPLSYLLDTVGDGSGTTNAIGNYSVTPQVFKRIVPVNQIWYLKHLHIQMTDDATFNYSDYGAIVGGLPVGYNIHYVQNGVDYSLLQANIMRNDHFIHYGFTYQLINFAGATDSSDALFEFISPLALRQFDYLYITLNDNLSTLVDHTFAIHGYR